MVVVVVVVREKRQSLSKTFEKAGNSGTGIAKRETKLAVQDKAGEDGEKCVRNTMMLSLFTEFTFCIILSSSNRENHRCISAVRER